MTLKHTSILSLILLTAACFAWNFLHPLSATKDKFQFGKGLMWNGGKPSLPVRIDKSGNSLVVDVLQECEGFQVSLRTEGVELKSETTMSQDCQAGHRIVLPLSLEVPETAHGYLIAEVTVRNHGETESMTKSFAYEGVQSRPAFAKPTSVDQNGARYHEFKTTSAH